MERRTSSLISPGCQNIKIQLKTFVRPEWFETAVIALKCCNYLRWVQGCTNSSAVARTLYICSAGNMTVPVLHIASNTVWQSHQSGEVKTVTSLKRRTQWRRNEPSSAVILSQGSVGLRLSSALWPLEDLQYLGTKHIQSKIQVELFPDVKLYKWSLKKTKSWKRVCTLGNKQNKNKHKPANSGLSLAFQNN